MLISKETHNFKNDEMYRTVKFTDHNITKAQYVEKINQALEMMFDDELIELMMMLGV